MLRQSGLHQGWFSTAAKRLRCEKLIEQAKSKPIEECFLFSLHNHLFVIDVELCVFKHLSQRTFGKKSQMGAIHDPGRGIFPFPAENQVAQQMVVSNIRQTNEDRAIRL